MIDKKVISTIHSQRHKVFKSNCFLNGKLSKNFLIILINQHAFVSSWLIFLKTESHIF